MKIYPADLSQKSSSIKYFRNPLYFLTCIQDVMNEPLFLKCSICEEEGNGVSGYFKYCFSVKNLPVYKAFESFSMKSFKVLFLNNSIFKHSTSYKLKTIGE